MHTLPPIQKNIPLSSYTTLGVGGSAAYFCDVHTVEELMHVISWAKNEVHPVHILGGGSNVLITDEGVHGLVIHPHFFGIKYETYKSHTLVSVGASVTLDALIEELISKELWGLENLSGIPGTVGATPIQNVGAYGVEVKDVIEQVSVFDTESQTIRPLSNAACAFGYRDSCFKKEPNRYVITEVTFRVSSHAHPKLAYKDMQEYFSHNTEPSLRDIRNAVLKIRSKKFPDWRVVGTAGSFFKNPVVSADRFESLKEKYPELPGFRDDEGNVKISLGWILDHVCGLRGYREGTIALYEKQALVLVCEKGTHATEILNFAQKIADTVFQKTKIHIEREVTTM